MVKRSVRPGSGFAGNLVGSLVILLVSAVISIGLPLVNRALPAEREVQAGTRLVVGQGVTVLPPAGAQLDVTGTSPARAVLLVGIGSVRVEIRAEAYLGSLAGLSERVRRRIEAKRGYQVSQDDHEIRTDEELAGRQGSYSSPGRNGYYAVFLSGGTAAEVTASGSELDLRGVLDQLRTMVASIEFGPAR